MSVCVFVTKMITSLKGLSVCLFVMLLAITMFTGQHFSLESCHETEFEKKTKQKKNQIVCIAFDKNKYMST